MSSKRPCKHCGKLFCPRAQNPNQEYCSEAACQKARKRDWQRQKLKTDPEYRDNQRDAQRRWREKNKGYWREYRRRRQEYTERNRQQQQARNLRRRSRGDELASIVKMDASSKKQTIIRPGRYELRLVEGGGIAKMDASIVEINVISCHYHSAH
jgi:Tfp pilus tip-associated adhesin PilY1